MNVSRKRTRNRRNSTGTSGLFSITRGGGNGDYRIPVFAPGSIQEAIELIYGAFELADRLRNPILILADGMMGQMMEPVVLPEPKQLYKGREELNRYKPWTLTGSEGKPHRNVIRSYRAKPQDLEIHIHDLFEKYRSFEAELVRYKEWGTEDAEIVFVAFGTMARIIAEVVESLRADGIRAGMIRPISLWPFPATPFEALDPKTTRVVVSAEMSMGQMIDDIRLKLSGRIPVRLINRTGGMIPTVAEITYKAKKILEERS